jgi:23S rRNA pseudouridine2605 synthase
MQGDNAWLTVSLREGRNREVRRVLEHVGLSVNRLIRIAYGPFQLGNLAKRAIEEVSPKVLREQIGTVLERPEQQQRPSSRRSGGGGGSGAAGAAEDAAG